jgi:hypothetical protein
MPERDQLLRRKTSVTVYLVTGYYGDGHEIHGSNFQGVYGTEEEARERAASYPGPTDIDPQVLEVWC